MRKKPRPVTSTVVGMSMVAMVGCTGASDVETAGQGAHRDMSTTEDAAADEAAIEDAVPIEDAATDDASDAVPPGDIDAGFDVEAHGQELVWRSGTEVEVLAVLPSEGESTFVSATVRPGSTATDATIVTLTMAEGMYDLRYLTYRDGEPSELTVFPEPYRPSAAMLADGGAGPIPVWAPDGSSLAWLEWPPEGDVQLRTIGWDGDTPGTGRTADDNAAFGVEVPPGLELQAWEAVSDGQTQLHATGQDGTSFTIALSRQADGGWAMDADAVEQG